MFRKLILFGGFLVMAAATFFVTARPSQAASYNGYPYFRPYTYQYQPVRFYPYQYRPVQTSQIRIHGPTINRPYFGVTYPR